MRIVFVANHVSTLISFRLELVERLASDNHEVLLVVPDGRAHESEFPPAVRIVDWHVSRKGRTLFGELRAVQQLRRILKDADPGVVLTYTVKANLYAVAARPRQMKRIQIATVTGLGSAMTSEGGMPSRILRWVYRHALGYTRHVCFQNDDNARALPLPRRSGSQTHLVPGSGVNTESFPLVPLPPRDTKLQLLTISRIQADKGIRELIECIRMLGGPGGGVAFTVVGWPEDAKLVRELKVLEIAGYCTFLSIVDQAKIFSLLAHCHALCHFSHHEGLSNVILEASSVGRPVVCPAIPGCADIVIDGSTGFLFPAGSQKDAQQCIQHLSSMDYPELAAMGGRARERVEKHFSRAEVVHIYLALIDSVRTGRTPLGGSQGDPRRPSASPDGKGEPGWRAQRWLAFRHALMRLQRRLRAPADTGSYW